MLLGYRKKPIIIVKYGSRHKISFNNIHFFIMSKLKMRIKVDNRIPTRMNLLVRNVLPTDVPTCCALCERGDESSLHLFLHCEVAGRVWQGVLVWWEKILLIPPNLFILWESWCGGERNKRTRNGLRVIWHTTIWVLWKARNERVFNNHITEVAEMVDEITVLSWRWSLDRILMSPCLYYEWCWNPKDCLLRRV